MLPDLRSPTPRTPLPMFKPEQADEVCCGPPLQPPSSPDERPGYRIEPFVDGFLKTPVGPVPRVAVRLSVRDRLGALRARLGLRREGYRVAPGLYAVGNPAAGSPVLVTANYKLSFDSLRRELEGIDAWLLVLDSRGVNVWCAAGKKTFATDELLRQMEKSRLAELVSHRRLILPQLGAPGVDGRAVKKGCGFQVVWGPVRAADLPAFLAAGQQADDGMRQVSFSFLERLVLVPVEINLFVKPSLALLLVLGVLAGLGPDWFTLERFMERAPRLLGFYATGVLAGAVAVPLLLPWLPGRRFYLKGLLTGMAAGLSALWLLAAPLAGGEQGSLLLLAMVVSSFLAMNFTGATPFTSPSGVEREMRQAIPVQLGLALVGLALWLAAPFFA